MREPAASLRGDVGGSSIAVVVFNVGGVVHFNIGGVVVFNNGGGVVNQLEGASAVDIGSKGKRQGDRVVVVVLDGPGQKVLPVNELVQDGGKKRVEVRVDAAKGAEVAEDPGFMRPVVGSGVGTDLE